MIYLMSLGAVLCVRWSPLTASKSLLASAADDSLVLIWQRVEYTISCS